MTTTVRYASPPRYVAWIADGDRGFLCACGHRFRLDQPLADVEKGTIRCRGESGRPCGRLLLLMAIRGVSLKLVAEVSRADMQHMKRERMEAEAQIGYLYTTAPRID